MSESDPSSSSPDAPGCTSSGSGAPRGVVVEVLSDPELDEAEPHLAPWLAEQLSKLAHLAGVERAAVTVAVVDDRRMGELHLQYHGDASSTDVLSFDMRDDPAEPVQGDLVLCVDEARRQAHRRGHEVRLELLLYALHGLLHLVGYDDREPAEARLMHRREDELLARAGFGAVYGDNDVKGKCANDQ